MSNGGRLQRIQNSSRALVRGVGSGPGRPEGVLGRADGLEFGVTAWEKVRCDPGIMTGGRLAK